MFASTLFRMRSPHSGRSPDGSRTITKTIHILGSRCAPQGSSSELNHHSRVSGQTGATPPEYVRPYVKAQKNDDRDAEGIAEAATRPTMRFVDLKSQDQLDIQTLHRSRDRLVGERTALINQLRAILLERGMSRRRASGSSSAS